MTISVTNNLNSAPKQLPQRPGIKFVFSHIAHFIAFGGGAGLSPKAPGTVGTLVAFPLYWILNHHLDPINFLLLIDILFILGIWVCRITGQALGAHDHGAMVWDEIVAFLLVLFFIPDDLAWQVSAFLLFRFFDIVKPQPIRYIDNKLRGGFGVMLDDLIAAFFTLLCLAGWKAMVLTAGRF